MIRYSWQAIWASLIFILMTHSVFASLLDNAIPDDEETRIALVSDPSDFFFQPFALLLTNNTGYKIQCSNQNELVSMLSGFGLDPNAIAFMPRLSVSSEEVVNSHYEDNPVLNCERGSEQLYVVTYPDNEDKYFIGFNQGDTALNMIGCQGLLDVMGLKTEDATSISYAIASQFFDTSDARDIHCMAGERPGPSSCGEYDNGSIWNNPIGNGIQPMTCTDGISVNNGSPICDINFEAIGSACIEKSCGENPHGSSWSNLIPNGSQIYSCDYGQALPIGIPSCNSTHEPDSVSVGGNCIPKSCGSYSHGDTWSDSISNGSQLYNCHFGEVLSQGSPTCDNDSMISGTTCVKNNCGENSHGTYWDVPIPFGSQSYYCDAGVSSIVGSPDCDFSYKSSGNSCVYAPKSCGASWLPHGATWSTPIFKGDGLYLCDDGEKVLTNTVCDEGYTESENAQCVNRQAITVSENSFSCAIKADDQTVVCWGNDNIFGATTVPSDLGPTLAVTTGASNACAIKSDQTVKCWGNDYYGQSTIPSDLGKVVDLATGEFFSCAVKASDRSVVCWGRNEKGQTSVPVDLGYASAITAGEDHTCAIGSGDLVTCWGTNTNFQGEFIGQATVPEDLGRVVKIAAGREQTCAITWPQNRISCWGENTDKSPIPTYVTGLISSVLGNAYSNTCIIDHLAKAHCWGNSDISDVPTNLGKVLEIASARHTCAIKENKTLICWGAESSNNLYGELDIPVELNAVF